MNTQGHNNPPDPLDEALSPYGDVITEAEGWLDGKAVENEGQMKAVDSLLKSIRAAKKAVGDAEESEAKPIYDQWKQAKARYAPTLTDLDRIAKGLIAISDPYKRKLAKEKQDAEDAAAREAYLARKIAEDAAALADPGNIEAVREADATLQAAKDAKAKLDAAKADQVKGLRLTHFHEVTDHKALLNWIARNDREAMTDFIEEYARKNAQKMPMDGVKVWSERVAA